MIKEILIIIVFFSSIKGFAKSLVDHSQLLEKAHEFMAANVELNNIRSKKRIILKHPSFTDHNDYQTVRYHQVLVDDDNKEWDVLGAYYGVHYSHAKDVWLESYQLYDWKNNLKFQNLTTNDQVKQIIRMHFAIPREVSDDDFVLRKKIVINASNEAKPVYWLELKARLFVKNFVTKPSPRVLVINAITKEVYFDFSKRKHLNKLFDVEVLSANVNKVIAKSSDKKMEDKDLKAKYPMACQLVETDKKNNIEPFYINPPQCSKLEIETTDDESAKRAYLNMQNILNYFYGEHNFRGYDNSHDSSIKITSLVHAGHKYDNAYWDDELKIMAYGDGSGNGKSAGQTKDYTLALDIAGHEFTHAIASNTPNFIYSGESGALDEGFADIFGILIARSQNKFRGWTIGSDLFENEGGTDTLSLRSVSEPSKYKTTTIVKNKKIEVPFPDKYSLRLAKLDKVCSDKNDQCEVHANSTIWSHNAYLIDQGFQKLGYNSVESDKKVSKLFFIALTHHLSPTSTFKQAAAEVLKLCESLLEPKECDVVSDSFKKTEILD